MANRFLNNIKINDSYTLPDADGTVDQIIKTDGAGELTFINQGDVIAGEADKAKSVILRVKNSTLSAMTKGQVICENVSISPPSGNLIEVALADNNVAGRMPALGILNEDLDAAGGNKDEGDAIMFGKVSGIDTSAFSVGDEVFVSDTLGGLTTTKPTGVKYIQKVGVVIRDDEDNGTIEVFGAGRVNDVPTPLYVDHANQRLGVGITSPQTTLHMGVQAANPARTEEFRLESRTGSGFGGNSVVNLYTGQYGTSGVYFGNDSTYTSQKAKVEYVDFDNAIYYSVLGNSINYHYWQNGGSTKMTLKNSFLGIGTTNPGQKLDVSGNIKMTETAATEDTDKFVVLDSGVLKYRTGADVISDLPTDSRYVATTGDTMTGGLTMNNSQIQITDSGAQARMSINNTGTGDPQINFQLSASSKFAIGVDNSDNDKFKISGSSALGSNDRIVVDSSGNVGIGTTTPTAPLHIQGGATSEVLKIEADANPYARWVVNGTNVGFLQFSSTNAYLSNMSNGSLLFRTNNTDKMTITGGGNVGIGTTNPQNILHLKSPNPYLILEDTSNANKNRIANVDGNMHYHADYNNQMGNSRHIFYIDNSEKLRINTNGNVGIGTTSPDGKLHIGGISDSVSGLVLEASNNGDNRSIDFQNTAGALRLGLEYDNANINLDIVDRNRSKLVTFREGGNVGIGTTSPGHELVVQGTSSPNIELKNSNYSNGGFILNRTNYGHQWKWWAESNVMYFGFSTDESTYSTKLAIESSGDVGIGTSNPGAKLHVLGSQQFILIESTANSDATYRSKTPLGYYGSGTGIGSATNCWNVYDFNAGAERMRISSSGNVGIGTTSPAEKLAINGSIRMPRTEEFYWTDGSVNGNPRAVIFSTSNEFGGDYNGIGFSIGANGRTAPSMYIRGTGNVGINTTNPNQKLTIKGNDNYVATEQTNYVWGGTNTIGVRMGTSTAGVLDFRRWDGGVTHGTAAITQVTSDGGWGLDFRVDNKSTNTSATTSRMFLSTSGEVGIGTTNPAAKLDVNQDAATVAFNVTGGNGGASLATFTRDVGATGSSVSINAQSNFPQIQFANTGNTFSIGGDTSGNFKISDNTAIGTNDRITIDNTGNVGIGATNPSEKLHVYNGSAYITPIAYAANQNDWVIRTGAYNNTAFDQGLKIKSTSGGASYMAFETAHSGGETMVLRSGKVGIGLDNPAYQLQLSTNSAAKPTSSAWTVVSDERVKTNIRPYETGLQELLQIEPKVFDYNGKAGFDAKIKNNIGIIAQEVKDIIPETVKTYEAKLNENDEENTELYNFDGHALTFALINSVKELSAKIESLETKIQTLENQ
jgi:hypothetical protein